MSFIKQQESKKNFANEQLRAQAAKALEKIVYEGRSSNDALANIQFENPSDTSLFKSIVLDSCRYFVRLEIAAKSLMKKSLRRKDQDIFCLIVIGIYQLEFSRTPDHAAIAETVQSVEILKKPWAKNLINAILRNYLRDQESLNKKLDGNWDSKYSTPDWLINKIKPFYKGKIEQTLDESNQQAPLTLRVNLSKTSRDSYLFLLDEEGISAESHSIVQSAIVLNEPLNVTLLPKFKEGWISVQDAAAQMSAWILQPKKGMAVIDACAAPGGKTAHLLEYSANEIDLTSVDIDDRRCERIEENLERLELDSTVICHDAIDYLSEYSEHFDQILLDVPCSGTGVIRRHPDIKLLRRESDIDELMKIQQAILEQAWGALKIGGKLLYATCSILQQENSHQIEWFLKKTSDCKILPLEKDFQDLSNVEIGCQILPGQEQMDGFYYCLLIKVG